MENLQFETKALHGRGLQKDIHNSIRFPVYAGVAFGFESAQDMEDAFLHRKPSHAYSRITNPSVELFEQTLTQLENGFGSIALSSGMAAITNALLALLNKGDNIIASKYLFGNTLSLIKETFKGFGIQSRLVDVNNETQLENAIDERSRVVFCETITNPQMNVSDFSLISKIAQKHNLVLVVDNTVTTPYLFNAKEHGVNVVVHSTTKYISGGATSVGGVIIDLGNYDWTQNPALKKYHNHGQFAFLGRLRKEVYRNFGSCMSPQTAYLQTLGLETLSLRISKSCDNALFIAQCLEKNPKINSVNYPGLESSGFYHLAKTQFNNVSSKKFASGGVISFELESRDAAFNFINRLCLIKRATNINDNKSLIIHPASTIFSDFTSTDKEEMGVTDKLVRLSVGIEDVKDLMDDINQAISKV
ncbi:MAG: aminotransferase class I/II-fold pyridoxal phosphate-dependent enzyme [Deltaproteobacteria bacterium]|jgi:O-acetylhomoserine (thiol)-lyase|nr:aminotransferase class I/II-fold pyridoxal phosphate-dependent enzyme [Deltaproteobacteria bacterium]